MKMDSTQIFYTSGGRPVFGGGGIMPDIFVPSDTTGVNSYYLSVANAGLIRKFAYEYCDLNRETLSEASSVDELLSMLPSDRILLNSFTNYALNVGGIRPRPYYIEHSRKLLVNQIKATITRDILGFSAYFEVTNREDPVMDEALRQIAAGAAKTPVTLTSDRLKGLRKQAYDDEK